MPQDNSRQRRQKKEQRRRDGAHPRPCRLAQLPSELLLMVMHHMDKGSLKSFVQTSRRMHHVREANLTAVFKGMQRVQFPGHSGPLSVFGDPTKRSDEQVEVIKIMARLCDWWRDRQPDRCPDQRTPWWQHFTDLAILEKRIDAETTALHKLGADESFDTALSKDAILLQWRLGLMMFQTTEQGGEQQVRMFLDHPAEVQDQLLNIALFLGDKIEEHVGLAAIAGCWARLEVHLPEAGSLEELQFVEWISNRVAAYTLATVSRCGPKGVVGLLRCEKNSTELSHRRSDLIEMLVNDQAEIEEGEFEDGEFGMGMLMGQTIRFHDATFAKTKQRVESALKFWRCQPAKNHMLHLKRFMGVQGEDY